MKNSSSCSAKHHSEINRNEFCRSPLESTIFFANCAPVYAPMKANQPQKDNVKNKIPIYYYGTLCLGGKSSKSYSQLSWGSFMLLEMHSWWKIKYNF